MIQRRKKREQPREKQLPESRIETFKRTAYVGQSGVAWTRERRNAP